jgi:uncharacterized membrane protein
MKTFARYTLYLLIVIVAVSAVYSYGFTPLGTNLPPPMQKNYQAHPFGIYTHVFAAVLALLTGPLQFSTRLRAKRPQLHRHLGRVYLGVGVFVGGLSGLYMAQYAFGGQSVQWGFASLAVAWLITGFKAYQSIRAGKTDQHRAWMVRNFSLTLAAVSLRVYLPLSMMAGVEFVTAYQVIAWACWVPNLVLAEIFFCRKSKITVYNHSIQGANTGA